MGALSTCGPCPGDRTRGTNLVFKMTPGESPTATALARPRRWGPRPRVLPAGHFSIAALIETVTFWLGERLTKLESVDFKLYFISEDRLEFILEILESLVGIANPHNSMQGTGTILGTALRRSNGQPSSLDCLIIPRFLNHPPPSAAILLI